MAVASVLVVGTVVLTAGAIIAYRLTKNNGAGVSMTVEKVKVLAGSDIIPLWQSRSIMMIIVSLVVLFSSIYIILSGNYDEGSQKWAFGTVGSIIGFWLRPEN